ncbi:MAG TPA: sigma-70 family RNA polymerase sigma factor [Solirubrobacteraceae bacterium]|nr:sigma-70 family RNA polymerase sigma factor [Solirubrobacteraceae bacterium]
MPASDESLLLQNLRSDRGEEAARALYRTYSGELFGFALNRLGDRGLAEEVVQDVFMRVWRHAAEYDATRGSVRTWLYGIARNAIVDLERHRSRRPPLAAREPEAEGGASADEPIERALLRWQVQSALERLTPEHREVVRLAHLGGLSVKEIADLTGLPTGTVKSRTYYALQNMRLALDEMEAL